MTTTLKTPYLLFLGAAPTLADAKTAAGIAHWRRDLCCGQLRLPGCPISVGLPDLDLATAKSLGAKSLIIGIAPMGGQFQPAWIEVMRAAAQQGYDIVSGMHTRLETVSGLAETAAANGGRLVNVRIPPPDIKVASGVKRPGRRLLTVGTDCAVGKKYTALAIDQALRKAGRKSTFRATGQTGIMISGSGIPIDAVVSDFVAGAAEMLSPANAADHWDIVEGQGSLFHPSYAGVTLGLVHGTQPDVLVLCHDLSRTGIADMDGYTIPPLKTVIGRYIEAAQLTNPAVRCIGVSVNASQASAAELQRARAAIETETGLPCVDPIREGVDRFLPALI